MIHHDSPIPVDVSFLPTAIDPSRLTGAVAIVIDVLRASTTIVHALAHGARAVIPVLEVEEAMQCAAQFERNERLLGGERQGELIPGFDLDNSPLKYSGDVVRDKTVIFTTTNGTRALLSAALADLILVGAMVNCHAVAKAAYEARKPIQILCAGTEGKISAEDVFTAGAIVAGLQQVASGHFEFGDAAILARDGYLHRSQEPNTLVAAFCESRGGRNLLELGFIHDIERSAMSDLFSVVP
ncbi:MAG: 2-phosphosulfolactate phosphatase, partial [Planctomycetota bacterium]|nr:2-phosphosulfolactate phosphatase [Planctomycetota bacterium]